MTGNARCEDEAIKRGHIVVLKSLGSSVPPTKKMHYVHQEVEELFEHLLAEGIAPEAEWSA